MRKRVLKQVVLAHTRDVKHADKYKGWVENNGGRYVTELSIEVTHLVASRKAFENYHDLGKPTDSQEVQTG